MDKRRPFAVTTLNGFLPGIVQLGDKDTAILFINGGAQTRVGPHRMYVRLAHELQQQGYSSFRFDLPGYGDAAGEPIPYFKLGPTIQLVCHQFLEAFPTIKNLILLGLCDGATAILLSNPNMLPACRGIILVNPWARQDSSHALTMVKHYYWQRVFKVGPWRKLVSGKFEFRQFGRDMLQLGAKFLKKESVQVEVTITEQNYLHFCWQYWQQFTGKTALFLSGQDLTAAEFIDSARQDKLAKAPFYKAWQQKHPEADHTFSAHQQQMWLGQQLLMFLNTLEHDEF